MTIRKAFLENPAFIFRDNIFYQRGLQWPVVFEKAYIPLREKENRVYRDEVVKSLPYLNSKDELGKEWMKRKYTLRRLQRYLDHQQTKKATILELGCGNGWLCYHLASIPTREIVGMDINEMELRQGSRVFEERENLLFAYADILTCDLNYCQFDYIILSASIQYFENLDLLLSRLHSLLLPKGEIHIVDSPFYSSAEVIAAKERTAKYFLETGFPHMIQHYHHHTWQAIQKFHPETLYNAKNFLNKIRGKFSQASPFPWIKISRN